MDIAAEFEKFLKNKGVWSAFEIERKNAYRDVTFVGYVESCIHKESLVSSAFVFDETDNQELWYEISDQWSQHLSLLVK